MAENGRFLSDREKLSLLESWFATLTTMRWQGSESRGGRGHPDADVVHWCLRLNRLPGVCTIQSCAGHREGHHHSSGHVWLRVSERILRGLEERAHDLAASASIECVHRVYRADGQCVIAITFQGNERDALADSMETICCFFEQIVAASGGLEC